MYTNKPDEDGFYTLADPSKLRVKGGRDVFFEDNRYQIQGIDYSPRKYKKYVATVKNKDTGEIYRPHFGDKRYEDYYQHKDKVRRERFLTRASAIKKADGSLASEDPRMPAYYATHANWNLNTKSAAYFYKYIPPDEWNKIPPKLRKEIRRTEKYKDKSLDDLYESARAYAKFTYMDTLNYGC